MTLVRISKVAPVGGFAVDLTFTDGVALTCDLTPYLRGPIFEALLHDPSLFQAVRVDPELGTIVWPNGADLDPDVLRGTYPPVWADSASSPA